ncbi:glycosyltransferase family 4 protein [Actinopolyspora mortivallis]|uniref:Glycosyl transferase n=1 Tax=Actinopolyspora mortivallis TaxID=33906 RepID=A0A2T0GU96_ACTMO|nr:glycosyltransferase family 1 protein [Actinopolyspora mortivallis]PRW62695.1 glycosyl transferase [Actinopolyspora mortivallis]
MRERHVERTRDVRVTLDGTPVLGRRTGIGRYTARLAQALAEFPSTRVRLLGLTTRGWRALRTNAPAGTTACGPPLPARLLRSCWSLAEFPPVELLCPGADVVHGTNLVQPPAARAAGVLTVHDLDFVDAADAAGAGPNPRGFVRSLHRAAVVCTPTRAVAERLTARFDVDPDRVVVTPLGVDGAWFHAAPPDAALRGRYGLPPDYLLFVGQPGPRKGLSTLVQALDPDLPPLVLAGPPPTEAPPTGSGPRSTGYLPEEELRRVVAGARALVLPSRDEGFGLPALEAMAAGTPVVCSDIPALREVTGGHALLAPYGDSSALRSALHRAVSSEGDHGMAAARRHAAEFTWRRCATETLRAYRLALTSR